MEKSVTINFKKLNSYCGNAFFAFTLFLLMTSSVVKAQSPYCSAPYYYNYGSCTYYMMSINAVDIKQGSTSLYYRAHNYYGSSYGGCNASYGDYTLFSGSGGSALFSFKAGATYQMGFTTGPSYPVNMFIWIDLNADNDFGDNGEFISVASTTTPKCSSSGVIPNGTSTLTYYTVTIPATATPGKTRMRIRSTYYGNGCYSSSDQGCNDMYYGECEDYTISLVANSLDASITGVTTPLCSPTMTATATNLGSTDITSLNVGWSVNGAYQTVNAISTTVAKQGGNKTINLSPDYNFVDGTTYTVKVWTYSPNGGTDQDKTDDTTKVTFNYIGPSGTPTTYDAIKCGPGKAPLKATTPYKTDSVLWYNASSAGSVVATGKNTLSPSLVLGTNTFYAQSFKISPNQKLENSLMGNYTYYTTGQAAQGGYANLTPKIDMFLDSFRIRLYTNIAGSICSVWMRTGSYVSYYSSSAGWTQIVDKAPSSVRTISGYYIATIKLPGIMLTKGTTYGFCVLSVGTNPVWTFGYNSAGNTASNADLDLFTQHYFYGSAPFTGYWSQGYSINLEANYRKATCPSSRIPIKITVNPSPNGAALTKGTPFQTTQPNTLGVISDPDIVAKGDKLTYLLTPPTKYYNAGYGSTWLNATPVVKTKKGTNIPSGTYWNYTPPNSSNSGTLTFTPDSSLVDSFLIVSMQIKDLGPYYCDSTILRHILVAPRPVVKFKFNQPVCDGDAVLFTDLSKVSSGTLTYKWDFGTGVAADTATVNTTVFKFPTFGTYMVKLTATARPYGYVESLTIPVVVTEIPKIGFKVLNACEKVPVTFNNTTTIGAGTITYAWDFGEAGGKSTAKSPTYIYKNAGAYKVTLRATASGCTAELSKNANQFATPVAKFTAPSLICDKSDVQFANGSTIKMGNMGYAWDFGDGGVSNFANPTHQFATSTNKSVKMKAVSEFGCVDSMVKIISLFEAPNADFTWGAACNLSNTNFAFTGSKPTGYLTNFIWDFAGEGSSTIESPSKLFDIVGRKPVTLTLVSNNGCSGTVTKEVNVKLQSKADFVIADVCEDDDAVFTNKSSVSQGNLNYNWKFGDVSNSAVQSPRHRYNIGGISQTYNVTLVAIVPGGCSDSISKPVTVNAKPKSNFTFSTSGRKVSFVAGQAGNTLYQWRFGDGGSSNSANTQYDYLNFPSGKYTACLAVINAAGCFSETCQQVVISGGIDKLSKLDGVNVYPNPNKGSFTVTVEAPQSDISIGVYNLLGDLVKSIETSSFKSTYSVDLNVANGVYLVKVINGGLTITQKVTINK